MNVNESLPALTRRLGPVELARYGGATWDWHRMHYDVEYARRAGFDAPVVDGQMLGALLATQIHTGAGAGWRLSQLSFRFSRLVFADSTVRCESEPVEVGPDRIELTGRVVVLAENGVQLYEAIATARAQLVRRS